MFVLVVSLKVKPERREDFLKAAQEDSRGSSNDEPNCLRFDVVEDNAVPNHFYFYEVYVDEAAFEAHRNSPHFPRWREAASVCLRTGDGQRNVFARTVYPEDYR